MGMVTVWLWDADGPAHSACGVTDHDGTAKDAAKQGMITTGADTATVEQATHLAGGGWMRSEYHRTGTGWTAERHGSRVRWSRFHRPERGRVMTASEQTVSDLERDLRERYPRARVTVTAEIDRVTAEVASKPDDSFKVTVDPNRIKHGSAVLAKIFRRF